MKFNVLKLFIRQGHLTLQITGDCMQKAMPVGSDIRLEQKPLYWPGDIIAFKRGENQVVSHRFLGYWRGRSGWLAMTRADNSRVADSPVALGNVLGRVTHVNGTPFQPGLINRLAAQAAWLPAITRVVFDRLSRVETSLRRA